MGACLVWRCTPLSPSTQEAEAGGCDHIKAEQSEGAEGGGEWGQNLSTLSSLLH